MIKIFEFFKIKKESEGEINSNIPSDPPFTQPIVSQSKATQDIISDTPLDSHIGTNELTSIAMERSDRLYDERQQRISKFNPYEIHVNTSSAPLTSTERYFLEKIQGQNVENPTVYAYWTYEYSIDFAQTMAKLMENGYLQLSDLTSDVEHLTVEQMKGLLKRHNLKVTGKKTDLIHRIFDNVPKDELASELGNQYKTYVLTTKGRESVSTLPVSMSKNLELEDLCLEYILSLRFNAAYKLVCENEIKKIMPRGMGIDWKSELANGLSDFKLELFNKFSNSNMFPIPSALEPHAKELKACVILGIFWGTDARKIADLFSRISPSYNYGRSELVTTLQTMQFALLDAIQKQSLDMLH